MTGEPRGRPRPERTWGDPASLAQPPPRRRRVVCVDVVERITDYLDDALPALERTAIDRHLADCADCTRALEQWRTVITLTGLLGEEAMEDLAPATRDELLAVFRTRPAARD